VSPELQEAIQSATTVGIKTDGFGPKKRHSERLVTLLVRSVIRELPADMTVSEILEEIGE